MEYTDIRNVFFTPHHVEHSCTKVIRGHCCSLGNPCTKVTPRSFLSNTVFQQWPLFRLLCNNVFQLWDRWSGMDGPLRCSLKLGREEHFRGEKTKKEIGRKKRQLQVFLNSRFTDRHWSEANFLSVQKAFTTKVFSFLELLVNSVSKDRKKENCHTHCLQFLQFLLIFMSLALRMCVCV